MTRHISFGTLILAACLCTGCFGDLFDAKRAQTVNTPLKLAPASESAMTTAYSVYSDLFAANSELGSLLSPNGDPNFRPPIFQVVGSPGVSIYHRGSTELYITEGLVNRCPPEGKDGKYMGKLAAVLASELSKMVVEAYYQKSMRTVTSPGNFAPQIPGDNSDHSDIAQQAILGDRPSPRARNSDVIPNQDPKVLARNYLSKANFSPNDLLQVEALIRKAEENPELEKLVNPGRSNRLFNPR